MSVVRFQPVCGADLASRAIAWWGCGYGGWSHIDCVLPDGRLIGARSDAVGGRPPGVWARPPHYERWIRRATVSLEVSARQAKDWAPWLLSQEGREYDPDAILGFLLGRRLHERGHWICSAFATHSLQRIGRLPRLPSPPSQVTPNEFVAMCAALGAKIVEHSR